ncbi:MAG TPA: aminomethyl-transferring glycine dehydrogenase subunit GcvPA [Candidatus Binatia bacterium]|nr:aminomethyl-transferring glycine dehydrogenase subunit GcvPA [Candidatus Binatia bacterium]
MRYLPKSDAERRALLAELGLSSMDQLFDSIPAACRLERPLEVPGPFSEKEIIDYFRARAGENAADHTSFLGAGVYNHLRSVTADALLQRGEFLTSYTPYQAEISQGTLQAIFEFQTLMCQLTGQEVANASMYDGSTATAEAALMAVRISGRQRLVVSRALHPEYRQVVDTYAAHLGLVVAEVPFDARTGQTDLAALGSSLDAATAAVVLQSPNFLGALENVPQAAELTHASGALLVTAIAEAVSLGSVRPPAEADIVAMETQSLGLAPSFGGPFAGVIATRERYVRHMPGRLAGQTTDAQGRRGFVLTLATREQHIRREKATSNICTNQALCALAVTMHLALLGKEGLREMAAQNLAKARYALAELEKLPGVRRAFTAPFFNEVTVEFPASVRMINQHLLREKIIGPLPLGPYFPEQTKRGLLCVTETHSRGDVDRLVTATARALEAMGRGARAAVPAEAER